MGQQRGDKIAKVSQLERPVQRHVSLSSGGERSLKGVLVEGITLVLQNHVRGYKIGYELRRREF